jgi:hypothetical protein
MSCHFTVYNSVSQTVVRGGLQAVLDKNAEIVSDTERMKSTSAKTAFVG